MYNSWFKLVCILISFVFSEANGQIIRNSAIDSGFLNHLVLVDEIDCSTTSHGFGTNGTAEVKNILEKKCRILKPSDGSGYFYYRIGANAQLKAGKAYFLEIEYPDDMDRNFIIQNRGGEYTRGIQTGKTIGDMHAPPYVQSNPESVSLPHSMKYMKWRTLFWLHDYYAGLELPRNTGIRPETPANGFLVIICQFNNKNNPFNNGAAVSAIRLYEAPDYETMKLNIHYPPEGMPRRHLFFREEMADGVVDNSPPAIKNPTDLYEHEAQLMGFLGMNTFSKDLLEFGHNQGWDPGPYANLVNTPSWKNRWGNIISMLRNYDLSVLPYYEYAGTIGPQGLGPQQRAHPLYDHANNDYTHISWVEDVNADITDPDSYLDLQKILERTILLYKNDVNFVGAWLRPRPSENPISFANAALNRFKDEANDSVGTTRTQLQHDPVLYQKYLKWWFDKRKQFLLAMRDYLRGNGVNDSAVILYTTDYSESGKTHYNWGYDHNVITDDTEAWKGLSYDYKVFDLKEYIDNNWHLEAQLLPENTWGGWEWEHSTPVPDPVNYKNTDGVMLTYTFNKAYTVGSKTAFDEFRNESGLAIIRHYCLNENGISGTGYFVADVEWHGPYTMLAEARAMANGDPWYIGYLASAAFNRGSVEYVREFNANFLALPALKSQELTGSSDDPEVIVRKIETGDHGTYLAVINTSMEAKDSIIVQIPQFFDVFDAVSGLCMQDSSNQIKTGMYPGQLKSYILKPVTGKQPQSILTEEIIIKKSGDAPFHLTATASSGLEVQWKLLSGPAVINGDTVTITGPGWINMLAEQKGDDSFYPVNQRVLIRVDQTLVNSTQSIDKNGHVLVYPNPTNGILNIEVDKLASIKLYDSLGKEIMHRNIDGSGALDLSEIIAGIYFVKITEEHHISFHRIIKEM